MEDPMAPEREAQHTLHICEYVNVSLSDVLDLLAQPGSEELLGRALRRAVGSAGTGLDLHASVAEQLSDTSARLFLDWRGTDREGHDFAGSARISLLVVQSGSEAITEVLAALQVDDDVATWVAAAARRFLGEVTAQLAVAAAA